MSVPPDLTQIPNLDSTSPPGYLIASSHLPQTNSGPCPPSLPLFAKSGNPDPYSRVPFHGLSDDDYASKQREKTEFWKTKTGPLWSILSPKVTFFCLESHGTVTVQPHNSRETSRDLYQSFLGQQFRAGSKRWREVGVHTSEAERLRVLITHPQQSQCWGTRRA